MIRGLKFTVATGLAARFALADEPSGITRCQSGAADILGDKKAFTVQVCNLFGATCYMNHPSVASGDCGTMALAIPSGECKLYPIFEYQDNGDRTGNGAVEELSTPDDLDCIVSMTNSVYKWSGACAAVQCSNGSSSFAGPAMTQSSIFSARTTGVSDSTVAANFQENTVVSLPSAAKQLKNVFLYRTGNYVATYRISTSGLDIVNGITYTVGALPTSDGNNYGPVTCSSQNTLMSAAGSVTAANARMCGASGKWAYWNAVNLIMDATLYTQSTTSVTGGSDQNIGAVPFLSGKSAYKSGVSMAHERQVKLLAGWTSFDDVLMTSDTITPNTDGASDGETAGCWRSYGVVFYCDDYTRTDLTSCAEANRKIFYVADPNPDVEFGTSVTSGSGSEGANDAQKQAAVGAATIVGAIAGLMWL